MKMLSHILSFIQNNWALMNNKLLLVRFSIDLIIPEHISNADFS